MSNVYGYGIDTSAWQGSKVDYTKAKLKGVDFVFLRIGHGTTKDKCFEQDYANAIKSGLKVGVYHYAYATSIEEAIADATRVLGWLNNRHLDFPVVYDIEDARQKKLSKETNSFMYAYFKNRIESTGIYTAMLYTGEYFFNNYFNKAMIDGNIWIAKYSSNQPSVGRQVSVWQFTSAYIDETYYKGKLDRDYLLINDLQKSSTPANYISLNPYAEPTRLLKLTLPYMRGNDVKWLQWELDFSGSDLDGIYGRKTNNAVLEFQKNYGLKVDGKVGPATRYALKYN